MTKITVNRYERNIDARNKCIKAKGCKCVICGFDFEKKYGEIGRGFIHVHHIKPIAEIGEEYEIHADRDLIPVCPNCHAMLHHGYNGKVLSVDELKSLISAAEINK